VVVVIVMGMVMVVAEARDKDVPDWDCVAFIFSQALVNMALVLCDPGDEVIVLAPYYYSQLIALQIAQAKVTFCPWDPSTYLPNIQVRWINILANGMVMH